MKRELLALGIATGAFLLNPHEAAAQESPVTEPTYQDGSCDDPNILLEVPTGNGDEYNMVDPNTGEICATLIPALGPIENSNPETTPAIEEQKPVEVQGIQIERDQLPQTGSQNGELTGGALALISLGAVLKHTQKSRTARYS